MLQIPGWSCRVLALPSDSQCGSKATLEALGALRKGKRAAIFVLERRAEFFSQLEKVSCGIWDLGGVCMCDGLISCGSAQGFSNACIGQMSFSAKIIV